jgi:hypothetical protein
MRALEKLLHVFTVVFKRVLKTELSNLSDLSDQLDYRNGVRSDLEPLHRARKRRDSEGRKSVIHRRRMQSAVDRLVKRT